MLYIHYSLIYYFSNQGGRLLSIFWKAAKIWHKMCKEAMRNMWSCVFLFCDTQNYHGNLIILSWNIIEKSLKFFEACLWESWERVGVLKSFDCATCISDRQNIARHTAHAVISWPKRWLMFHINDYMMMVIATNILHILTILKNG